MELGLGRDTIHASWATFVGWVQLALVGSQLVSVGLRLVRLVSLGFCLAWLVCGWFGDFGWFMVSLWCFGWSVVEAMVLAQVVSHTNVKYMRQL